MPSLAEIRIYPVKGLRGSYVTQAVVEPWGIKGDRRWMLVDAQGVFLSQRKLPKMATIDACLLDGGLRLSADGVAPLEVSEPGRSERSVEVAIWKSRVPASAGPPESEAWLSAVLGTACRLVFMADPADARPADPEYALASDRVSFADGYPLLVTSAASLADLNARLDRPVPMERFRTNLAIDGAAAWAEDRWHRLQIGDAAFEVVKTCDRCAVTTVDQVSGRKFEDNEPLQTLGGFRRDGRGRIIFGQNLVPRRLGSIAVGDAVAVVD